MAPTEAENRTISPTLALCLALIGAASMLYYHQGLFMPRVVAVRVANGLGHGYSFGNDFYQVWLSARELFRQRLDPYSPEMTREIQVGLYGRPLDPDRPGDPVDRRVFPYPAYTDLLFWPVTLFSFSAVRIVVLFGLIAMTAATPLLWLRALNWNVDWKWSAVLVLLTLCSYAALEGLFAGQLGLMVAFLLALSLGAIRRERYFLSGILLALTTIKPQNTALVILFLILWALQNLHSRRGFLVGFFSTLGVLLATSLAVLPHWIASWTHTVLAYRHYTRPPLITEVVTSSLGPQLMRPATILLTAISLLVAVVLAWRYRAADFGSREFWLTLGILLSITAVVVLPGQAVYDHLILLPGILLVIRYRGRLLAGGLVPRILVLVGALILFWNWIAAFLLIALRPILTASTFDSTALFSIPIRSAASLPFAVLALLAWSWKLNATTRSASA
jgi:hypothetical protein